MLDINLVKKHLNIEKEFTEDDTYIMSLTEAAEEAVKNHLMLDKEDDFYDDSGDIKPSIRHAILLLVGTWYANRESVSYGVANKIPHGYEYILQHFKTYHW